jgi:hypothetical protein
MKLTIVYHSEDEFSSSVERFGADFEVKYGVKPELVSLETIEGAEIVNIYEITQYPAILVVSDDGRLSKGWFGPELPLMDEVYGYYNT